MTRHINNKKQYNGRMLDKRGASHADWAISLGIFLVYILSMLMIIQPGVQPIYKEDRLLKIAKDNYKANTSYSFYKTPLLLTPTDITPPPPGTYKVRITGNLPFSGSGNNFAVTDSAGNVLVPPNFYFSFDTTDELAFDAQIVSGKNKFYVITNKKADGTSEQYDRFSPSPDATLIKNDSNFTYIFGSTEVLTGVDEAQLTANVNDNGLMCEDKDMYNVLKNRWGYPASKDFATYYVEGSSPQYTADKFHGVCNQTQPYEQASVFAEEWAARMFTAVNGKYGKTEPIRMVVRAW